MEKLKDVIFGLDDDDTGDSGAIIISRCGNSCFEVNILAGNECHERTDHEVQAVLDRDELLKFYYELHALLFITPDSDL